MKPVARLAVPALAALLALTGCGTASDEAPSANHEIALALCASQAKGLPTIENGVFPLPTEVVNIWVQMGQDAAAQDPDAFAISANTLMLAASNSKNDEAGVRASLTANAQLCSALAG